MGKILLSALMFWLGAALMLISVPVPAIETGPAAEQRLNLAAEAYMYAYPLVLMDVTRKVQTTTPKPDLKTRKAPANQIISKLTFSDYTSQVVVRPNPDVFNAVFWGDLTGGPLVLRVAKSPDRYYLLSMYDMFTNIFAAPGWRTTGRGAHDFLLVGPDWQGKVPRGMELIRSPHNSFWMIGRIQANGEQDKKAKAFIRKMRLIPLCRWGSEYSPPNDVPVDRQVDVKTPPMLQVRAMSGKKFFEYFAELLKLYPAPERDKPFLARLQAIGFEAGKSYHVSAQDQVVRQALEQAADRAYGIMKKAVKTAGVFKHNWLIYGIRKPLGVYGTDYPLRAAVAMVGLGANKVKDTLYALGYFDAEHKPFAAGNKYQLHFDQGALPPSRAYWSICLYDKKGFLINNPIGRYSIGDRDNLRYNQDGSIDIYIQAEEPSRGGGSSNWLPAPEQGGFSLTMRIYWPGEAALDLTWLPPLVNKVE